MQPCISRLKGDYLRLQALLLYHVWMFLVSFGLRIPGQLSEIGYNTSHRGRSSQTDMLEWPHLRTRLAIIAFLQTLAIGKCNV